MGQAVELPARRVASPRSRQKELESRLGEMIIIPCKHCFPGYSARQDEIFVESACVLHG